MWNNKINHGRLDAAHTIAAVAFAPHILTLREKCPNTERFCQTSQQWQKAMWKRWSSGPGMAYLCLAYSRRKKKVSHLPQVKAFNQDTAMYRVEGCFESYQFIRSTFGMLACWDGSLLKESGISTIKSKRNIQKSGKVVGLPENHQLWALASDKINPSNGNMIKSVVLNLYQYVSAIGTWNTKCLGISTAHNWGPTIYIAHHTTTSKDQSQTRSFIDESL